MVKVIETRASQGLPVLIAEIGVNYYDIATDCNMSLLDAACYMIEQAHSVGIHAVKFQSYKAETLASRNSPAYWDLKEEPTETQYALFKKYDQFEYEDYSYLAQYADKIGVEFFSTPFDFVSADYICDIVNVLKISSSDITNIPLVTHISRMNKPIIASVGASTEFEIDEFVHTVRRYNNQMLILMHCILEYPTDMSHANLNRIKTLRQKYDNTIVGYSDHTKPDDNMLITTVAYALGAKVIEKHFTTNKALSGNDHYHAMDTHDAAVLLNNMERIDQIMGGYSIYPLDTEHNSRLYARRSIYTKRLILAGEVITNDVLIYKRPGIGISPRDVDDVLGRRAKCDIPEDCAIMHDMLI